MDSVADKSLTVSCDQAAAQHERGGDQHLRHRLRRADTQRRGGGGGGVPVGHAEVAGVRRGGGGEGRRRGMAGLLLLRRTSVFINGLSFFHTMVAISSWHWRPRRRPRPCRRFCTTERTYERFFRVLVPVS